MRYTIYIYTKCTSSNTLKTKEAGFNYKILVRIQQIYVHALRTLPQFAIFKCFDEKDRQTIAEDRMEHWQKEREIERDRDARSWQCKHTFTHIQLIPHR